MQEALDSTDSIESSLPPVFMATALKTLSTTVSKRFKKNAHNHSNDKAIEEVLDKNTHDKTLFFFLKTFSMAFF